MQSHKTTIFANRQPFSGDADVDYRTITFERVFTNNDTTVTWTITSNKDKNVNYTYQYPGLTDDMVTDPQANGSVYFAPNGVATIQTNLDPNQFPDQLLETNLQIVTPYGVLAQAPITIESVSDVDLEAANGNLQATIVRNFPGNTIVTFNQTEQVVFTRIPTYDKPVEMLLVQGGGAQESSLVRPLLRSGPPTDGSGNERIKFDQNTNVEFMYLGGSGGQVLNTTKLIQGNATVGANTTIVVGVGGDPDAALDGQPSSALGSTADQAGLDSNSIFPGTGAAPSGSVTGTLTPAYFSVAPGANTVTLSSITISSLEQLDFYVGNSNHVKIMRQLGPFEWTKPIAISQYSIYDATTPSDPKLGIQFAAYDAEGDYAILLGARQNGMGVPNDITGSEVYYGGGGANNYYKSSVDWANVTTIPDPMAALNQPWPGGSGLAGYNAAYTNGTTDTDRHAHTALIPYDSNPVYCDGNPYDCRNLPPADFTAQYYINAATGTDPVPNTGAGASGAGRIARADIEDQFCLSGDNSINFVTYNQYNYGKKSGADGVVVLSWETQFTRAFRTD